MLRSAGIRSKILAVLVVPLVLLGITTGLLATSQVAQARQAFEVEKIAAIGGPFGELVRGIAAERALTSASLQGDAAAAEALPAVRAQVDAGLVASREAVADIDFGRLSVQAEEALSRVEAAHVQLGIVRATVDRGGASVDDVVDGYGDVLREDLAMPGRVAAGVDDPRTADLLTGFGHLLVTRDLALQEQEVGLRILNRSATADDGTVFATLAPAQEEEIARWQFAVGSTSADAAAELVGRQTRTVWSIGRGRVALSSPGTVGQTGLTPQLWTEITDARVNGLDAALADIAAQVDVQAAAASQRATLLATTAVAAAVLGVGVTVLLSLVLARRISRPLRELTLAATSVREQLPVMVEQMRSPGQMPDVQLPHIEVVGDDEVGRLAAAFNDVNDTVVRVAEEQAALRGSIAETFVNVARRNQVLLSRQLSFIDQLEQREENPDTLENLFRLDHLATRMRRNAESLLVLANIDAGRRLRQPLALSDVIRTAASEIEQYERVNLALQVDPPTMGHLSLQLAHLLAELLENGTNFSEPHTPVLVATSRTATGVRITVTDEGLGLTDDEVETARAKISDFAADDVVTSQRLGFFVVGRLARRLGVTVSVRRGAAKGLVVTVDLPPSVFVPGTVTLSAPSAGTADAPGALTTGPSAPPAPGSPAPASQPQAPAPSARPQVPSARPQVPAARAATPSTPSTSAAAPAAPVVPSAGPAPARPAAPARPSGASIPMPGQVPADAPAPAVTVSPGGITLPRRGQSAPAAAASPAPAPSSEVQPGPSAPAPGSSLPAPSVVPPASVGPLDETPALSPVVAAGSASLPSRARRAAPADAPAPVAAPPTAPGAPVVSAPSLRAVPAPAVAPSAPPVPAARTAPVEPATAAPAAVPEAARAGVAPGFSERLGTSGPAPLPGGGDHGAPPRRAGLFGAFRARREDGEPGADAPAPSNGVPAPRPAPAAPAALAVVDPPVAVAPVAPVTPVTPAVPVEDENPFPPAMSARLAPVVVPPAQVPDADAAPVAPAAPVVPPAAVPPPAARVAAPRPAPAPAPAPTPAPAPASAPAPAAVVAPARVEPPAPAPEPHSLVAAPVSILPGGARRRGRRSLFGGSRADTPVPPPAPVAAVPTVAAVPFPAPVHDPARALGAPAPSAPSVPSQASGPPPGPGGFAGQLAPRGSAPAQPAPASLFAAPPVPAAGLPARVPSAQAQTPPTAGGVPVVPALADGEAVRQRSMLASEALSELSRLSSYSPSAVEGRGGPAPLVRRQPAATEAARIPPPAPPAGERRQRSAADVRSMLSGFQSGVTRGRAEDGDGETAGTTAGTRVPAGPPTTTTRTTDTRTTD